VIFNFGGTSQPSIWLWLGPVLLFAAAMITLWFTNWRADQRHREQLVAQRNDRFREEVAKILAERWDTERAASDLADAVGQYRSDGEMGVVPADQTRKLLTVRDEQLPQFRKVELLAAQAALLSNDARALAALADVREIAEGWKDIIRTLARSGDPHLEYADLLDKVQGTFDRLETVTHSLVTSDGIRGTKVQWK
jgi:hypothetical protein